MQALLYVRPLIPRQCWWSTRSSALPMALVQRFLAVVEGSPAQQQEHDWKMQETRNASLLDKKGKQHDFKFCLWVLLTDRHVQKCRMVDPCWPLLLWAFSVWWLPKLIPTSHGTASSTSRTCEWSGKILNLFGSKFCAKRFCNVSCSANPEPSTSSPKDIDVALESWFCNNK